MSDITIRDAERQHRQDIARALRAAADDVEKGGDFLGAVFNVEDAWAEWSWQSGDMVADLAASPDCHGARSSVLVPVWTYAQITEDCPHADAEFSAVPILDHDDDYPPCALCQHDDDVRNHPRDRP